MKFALAGPNARGKHVHRVRVGYVDTDKAGVAHHTAYLVWMEAGRIEYLRERSLDYRRFEVETGLALPVVEAHLAYRAPARFDEELEIETWVAAVTRARILFESRICRAEGLLCEGRVAVACVDLRQERARSIPDVVRAACA